MKQIGLSPKVLAPAIGQIVAGVVLLILGNDVEGRTAIATGLGTLLVGYHVSPGQVTQPVEVGSDALNFGKLDPETKP